MSCAERTFAEIRLNCVLKTAELFRPAFKLSTFGALGTHAFIRSPFGGNTII